MQSESIIRAATYSSYICIVFIVAVLVYIALWLLCVFIWFYG